MRHIPGHCGHSEAHYKHLHMINNIMIKMHKYWPNKTWVRSNISTSSHQVFKRRFEKVSVDQEYVIAAHTGPDDRDLARDVTVGTFRRDLYDDTRLDGLLTAAETVRLYYSLNGNDMRIIIIVKTFLRLLSAFPIRESLQPILRKLQLKLHLPSLLPLACQIITNCYRV